MDGCGSIGGEGQVGGVFLGWEIEELVDDMASKEATASEYEDGAEGL